MRIWSRLIARRSNQVMYAMPVSRATMMMSERIESNTISDTGDQRLGAKHIAQRRMLLDHRRPLIFQRCGDSNAESLRKRHDDAPVGARVPWRRGAPFLA